MAAVTLNIVHSIAQQVGHIVRVGGHKLIYQWLTVRDNMQSSIWGQGIFSHKDFLIYYMDEPATPTHLWQELRGGANTPIQIQ